jgi:hypothetical protein
LASRFSFFPPEEGEGGSTSIVAHTISLAPEAGEEVVAASWAFVPPAPEEEGKDGPLFAATKEGVMWWETYPRLLATLCYPNYPKEAPGLTKMMVNSFDEVLLGIDLFTQWWSAAESCAIMDLIVDDNEEVKAEAEDNFDALWNDDDDGDCANSLDRRQQI